MIIIIACLWLIFIFSLLFYLFKKYLYDDLFNQENIEKRKIEIQKQKEYLAKRQFAINLSEGKALIKKFNWAAFLIPGLWGISYKTWQQLLLCFIPIPFLANIIFGIKGNEWALSKYYSPIETYIFEQKIFIIIGIILNLTVTPILLEKFFLS